MSSPICSCGRVTRRSSHEGICKWCWFKTPEGRKYNANRQREFQAERRWAKAAKKPTSPSPTTDDRIH
jgi:hypothetical protein